MGLFNSVKKRLTIQLIGVSLEENGCNIQVERFKKSKMTYSNRKSFSIESKEVLSKEIINYLNILQSEHEQTYVVLFLNTLGQGAIPGCDDDIYKKFGIDKNGVKSVCIDNRFTIYASLIDISWADRVFKKVGLDFIFSPFLILNAYIDKDNDEKEVKLYILNTNNGLTIMVKNARKLLYASFFNVAKEQDLLLEDFENIETQSSVDLEEELFDEFDLDSSEVSDDMQELNDEIDYESNSEYSRLSGKDLRFVKYLDAALKEFYDNDLYDSQFITKVKIYDDAGMHKDVVKHIENDLLLDTSAENINLLNMVIKVAKEEVLSYA